VEKDGVNEFSKLPLKGREEVKPPPRPPTSKNLRAPSRPARKKPTTRPWSERPVELEVGDLQSVRPASNELDLTIDLDVGAGQRRDLLAFDPVHLSAPFSDVTPSVWSQMDWAKFTPGLLAAPQLPNLDTDGTKAHSSLAEVRATIARFARAQRTWLVGLGTVTLAAAATWAAIPLARGRSIQGAEAAVVTRQATDVAPAPNATQVARSPSAAPAIPDSQPSSGADERVARDAPGAESTTASDERLERSVGTRPSARSTASAARGSDPATNPPIPAKTLPAPLDRREAAAAAPRAPAVPAAVPPPARSPEAPVPPSVSPVFGDIDTTAEFNRNAAMEALRQAGDSSRACVTGASSGGSRVAVTFVRNGSVSDVAVDGVWSGTPIGACIAAKFRALHIPSFRGSSMTVRKTLSF
jgi:hypothetical protein